MQRAIENLEKFPRLELGFYPTPLEELCGLRKVLGKSSPRIFIKRDDWTGFGFGGNKIRKMEFLFAKLLSENVKTVITTGGERSNHARMTAAVCAKLGLKCILILDRKPRPVGCAELYPAANFIEEMYGADVYLTDSIEARNAQAKEIFDNLNTSANKIYQIPLGGAAAISTLGFVRAMCELSEQMKAEKLEFNHLFFSSSTAGTQTGMLIGAKLFGLKGLRIVGISPEPNNRAEIVLEIERLLKETGALLEIETAELTAAIEVFDEYAGEDYCVETQIGHEIFRNLAKTDGVILDSVYTAKAFSALIDQIEKGRLPKHENVLFWHTGGQLTQFYVPQIL